MIKFSWVFYFYYLFTFLIKSEFVYKTFKVEPYYAKVTSLMRMEVQVTHPPGPMTCECILIDDKINKEVYRNKCVNVVQMSDYDIKYLKFDLKLMNVSLSESYYKVKYFCKYYCRNNAWHDIHKFGYLIINDSPFHPKFDPKNNYVNNNTKEIVEFMNKTSDQQIKLIDNRIDEFVNKTDENNGYLQKSILISQLLSVSDCLNQKNDNCSNFLKHSQELVLEKLNLLLNCDKIRDWVFLDTIPERILSLSALNLVYQTMNKDNYIEKSLLKAAAIGQCLATTGYELIKELNIKLQNKSELFYNVTEDYLTAVAISTSNNLGILKDVYSNVTTSKNDSLIIDNTTLTIKSLIEKNSLLLAKNDFINFPDNTLKTDNLVYLNKRYTSKKSNLRNLYPNPLGYDTFIINNNLTKINVSLPIDYMIDKYSIDSANLGAILYNNYPLLSANNRNYSANVLSLKFYKNSSEEVNINDLIFPVNLIFDRPSPKYNICLYYDNYNQTWNNKHCRSVELSENQILCQCNHLSDFTISSFNPIYIYDDIVNILNDTNWMTSFEEFKNLNASNALIIYIYSFLTLLYLIGLFFTISYDKSRDSYFFDLSNMDRPNFCDRLCSKKKIVNDIINIKLEAENDLIPDKKKKIKEHLQKTSPGNESTNDSSDFNKTTRRLTVMSEKVKVNDNFEIEYNNLILRRHTTEISEFRKNLYESFKIGESKVRDSKVYLFEENPDNQITEDEKELLNSSFNFRLKLFRQLVAVMKVMRQNNIYTALFADINYKLNKTDTLSLIFFNITTSFAVCGLFSPANSKSGNSEETSYGYKFFNRSIAVSVITIIIVHIPTKIISILLRKKEIYRGEKKLFRSLVLAIIIRVIFYLLMIMVFVIGLLNTTWIYLRNKKVDRNNVFVDYYFIMLILKLFGKFLIFFIISVIVYIIIKNPKVPKWKIFVIFLSVILSAII